MATSMMSWGDMMAKARRPPCRGLLPTPRGEVTVPFNDLATLEATLAGGDIACVLSEPMLTNFNLIFPDDDFWTQAAAIIRAAGALLIIDEAHTHSFAYGGLTNAWQLSPDVVTLGKGLGSGVPSPPTE